MKVQGFHSCHLKDLKTQGPLLHTPTPLASMLCSWAHKTTMEGHTSQTLEHLHHLQNVLKSSRRLPHSSPSEGMGAS